MNKLILLLIISFLHFSQSSAQWTAPRLVDSTLAAAQSNPVIAIGPNRELAIAFNENAFHGKLVLYKSTDLGNSFTRILVDSGYGTSWPWPRYFLAGVTTELDFDQHGKILLLIERSWIDDIAQFTNYFLKTLPWDSTQCTIVWSAVATEGPGPPILKKPKMFVSDSAVHIVRGIRDFTYSPGLMYVRLSGDSLRSVVEYSLPVFSSAWHSRLDASVLATSVGVHVVGSEQVDNQNCKMYYSRKLHGDSAFIDMIPIDTLFASSPRIADLGFGDLAILYATGNGLRYSDSLLTVRLFDAGSLEFSPPFKLTVRPILPTEYSTANSPRLLTHGTERHLAFRSFEQSMPIVAYYRFGDLQLPPVDSTIFRGYYFGDLVLDSLGGKYLVMVGPDGKVYLTKKDVVSSVQENIPAVNEFTLLQNYPNPFNPTTTISYSITQSIPVRLTVFDLLGREVATLVNEQKEAGSHRIAFDASSLSSGIYFYQLRAGSYLQTKKMVLLR